MGGRLQAKLTANSLAWADFLFPRPDFRLGKILTIWWDVFPSRRTLRELSSSTFKCGLDQQVHSVGVTKNIVTVTKLSVDKIINFSECYPIHILESHMENKWTVYKKNLI